MTIHINIAAPIIAAIAYFQTDASWWLVALIASLTFVFDVKKKLSPAKSR